MEGECTQTSESSQINYLKSEDQCFKTEILCLEPVKITIDAADVSDCDIFDAQKDCTTKVESPEPEYILADGQCFETTT